MDKNKGGRPEETGATVAPVSEAPTLAEVGVSQRQSSDWQAAADVPEPEFEFHPRARGGHSENSGVRLPGFRLRVYARAGRESKAPGPTARGGCAVVERLGGYVGVTAARLKPASALLDRHGERAIILGRLVPGLCILTAVAAGILGFSYHRFLPALAVGGLLHLLVFVMLGYVLGPPALRIATTLHMPFELLASAILLVALTAWLVRAARRAHANPAVHAPLRDRVHYGVLAGLLGAIESMLLANVLLHLTGLLAYRAPAEALVASGLLGKPSAEALVVAMMPAFVVIPTLWGAAYGLLEPALPGPAWLRGTVFASIPLACSLLVILPLVGAGVLGLQLGAGSLPALGELARHLAYGLAIGSTFPILVPCSPSRAAS